MLASAGVVTGSAVSACGRVKKTFSAVEPSSAVSQLLVPQHPEYLEPSFMGVIF